MPTFQLGFKCPWPGFGPAGARQELIGDLAAEALMGESSRLYLELYRKGLIDSSFAAGYEDMPGVALLLSLIHISMPTPSPLRPLRPEPPASFSMIPRSRRRRLTAMLILP